MANDNLADRIAAAMREPFGSRGDNIDRQAMTNVRQYKAARFRKWAEKIDAGMVLKLLRAFVADFAAKMPADKLANVQAAHDVVRVLYSARDENGLPLFDGEDVDMLGDIISVFVPWQIYP